MVCLTLCPLGACNGEAGDDGASAGQDGGDAAKVEDDSKEESGDTYDDYIKNALATVGSQKAPENDDVTDAPVASPTAYPTPYPTQALQPAQPSVTDTQPPQELFTSSDDNTDPVDPAGDRGGTTASSTGSSSTSPDDTPTPTPTPYITPDEFEVGKCCIYMNGESDSAFGSEVVTAINKTRKDLGYPELVKNTSLATCADRRTREIAALRSHLRPNGQMYYTLAPEHFKAEMIIVGTQKAGEAVDTLIKTDPASRYLVFTQKYQSIGASSFKTNGLNFTVVAFGL